MKPILKKISVMLYYSQLFTCNSQRGEETLIVLKTKIKSPCIVPTTSRAFNFRSHLTSALETSPN